MVSPEEMQWKISALPDTQAKEGEDAIIMQTVDPGVPLGQYQTFYLGRMFDRKGKGPDKGANTTQYIDRYLKEEDDQDES